MAFAKIQKILNKIRLKLKKKEMAWHQFKLIVTNPPRYNGHFVLIKTRLVPFVKQYSFDFWITNYHNQTYDFILFRVRSAEKQLKHLKNYLDTLKQENLIFDWEYSTWNPAVDARNRIEGLRNASFNPDTQIITRYERTTGAVHTMPSANLAERQQQLTALFEAVGGCSKSLYEHLAQKPNDPWAISLFIHLLLNSLDFSGPNQFSEEDNIRTIPPF